jgi:hypothetical protein
MKGLLIDTGAFTAEGWVGGFYPEGMRPRDFLSYYAAQFSAVELDNTFCRTPSASTVEGWNLKTPAGGSSLTCGCRTPGIWFFKGVCLTSLQPWRDPSLRSG